MREILFRGKRSDCGEWIYGYYFKADRHWHEHGIHKDWIATSAIQNGGWCNVCGKYPVIPETVGQYTGLTDRNGNKIFEGDIVEQIYDDDLAYVVIWDETGALFCLKTNRVVVDFYYCLGEELEVIGNIHDNPELISGDGNAN